MNPSESILYPPSYYSDIAFFLTKCMTNIFTDSHSDSPSLHNSDTPIIEAAIDGHFSSDWESQLYHFILATFRKSMLDDSVPIGTAVLLDLLCDLHKMGQTTDGQSRSRIVLPAYPHRVYRCYFIGAFMLAHTLLSRDGPRDEVFWENVLSDDAVISLGGPSKLENVMRKMLEDNIAYYAQPKISPDDLAAYQLHCADGAPIRPNRFIPRLSYHKMKGLMYAHIRVRMTSRGEHTLDTHPYLPPCQGFMADNQALFAKMRRIYPQLEDASDKEIHAFLEEVTLPNSESVVGLGFYTD